MLMVLHHAERWWRSVQSVGAVQKTIYTNIRHRMSIFFGAVAARLIMQPVCTGVCSAK